MSVRVAPEVATGSRRSVRGIRPPRWTWPPHPAPFGSAEPWSFVTSSAAAGWCADTRPIPSSRRSSTGCWNTRSRRPVPASRRGGRSSCSTRPGTSRVSGRPLAPTRTHTMHGSMGCAPRPSSSSTRQQARVPRPLRPVRQGLDRAERGPMACTVLVRRRWDGRSAHASDGGRRGPRRLLLWGTG